MQPLRHILLGTLDWVRPTSSRLLQHLATRPTWHQSCDSLAQELGFSSRHQLARHVQRDGLPPIQELRAWITVLEWVVVWERAGVSLCRQALAGVVDPGSCYRRVRRVTGLGWSEVRKMGIDWVASELRRKCRQPLGSRPPSVLAYETPTRITTDPVVRIRAGRPSDSAAVNLEPRCLILPDPRLHRPRALVPPRLRR